MLTHLLQLFQVDAVLQNGLCLPYNTGGPGDEPEPERGGRRLEALHAKDARVHVEGEGLKLHRAQERHLGVPKVE